MFALGRQRYLQIKEWNGQKTLDIRIWDNDKIPSKVGISLPLLRLQSICHNVQTIDDAMRQSENGQKVDFRLHIGNKDFVCINSDYPCINIRRFWFPADQTTLTPSQKGITLNRGEWDNFMGFLTEVEDRVPELQGMIPCYRTHQNQEGMWTCSECLGHQPDFLKDVL